MTLRWRIYYGDGTVFDPGDPYDAPALNVQLIANACREHGWGLVRETDYYWYNAENDDWYGGDIFGLWDYLSQSGPKKVLFGRSISNEQYQVIYQRAMNDPDMPQKTGWTAHERKNAGITQE